MEWSDTGSPVGAAHLRHFTGGLELKAESSALWHGYIPDRCGRLLRDADKLVASFDVHEPRDVCLVHLHLTGALQLLYPEPLCIPSP